jgi:CDP-glucose 4,6-dehydratase
VPASSLVTGGRGFVGAWLCKALLERGDQVVGLDRPATDGRPSGLELLGIADELTSLEVDLLDQDAVSRGLAAHDVDTVFHLGAQTIVGAAASSPAPTFETNVRGTWTVLEACRREDIGRVVVASSDKAYGAHDELPYTEELALRPTAPYEASKAAADLIARSYWPSFGLPVAVTRFANVYGGGDTNYSRLIPEAVSAALDHRPPVLRSDGSPERDFLYVEDAASAYLAIADGLDRDEVRGEAFNAGGGRPYSVGQVVALIARLAGTGVEPAIRGAGSPAGEIDRQCVDPAKIKALVGWEPRVTLEDGLRKTVEWYREHPAVRAPEPFA